MTGLLGPNGAGKTTLLRILATVLPTSRRVRLLGRAVHAGERAEVRRRLGYLPQEMGFPRGFTGFAFVDYMAVLKEWTEGAAARRGTPGARPGRARRRRHEADPQASPAGSDAG